jgi:hypothetical protein
MRLYIEDLKQGCPGNILSWNSNMLLFPVGLKEPIEKSHNEPLNRMQFCGGSGFVVSFCAVKCLLFFPSPNCSPSSQLFLSDRTSSAI